MRLINTIWLESAWNKTHHLFASPFRAPQTAHRTPCILRPPYDRRITAAILILQSPLDRLGYCLGPHWRDVSCAETPALKTRNFPRSLRLRIRLANVRQRHASPSSSCAFEPV